LMTGMKPSRATMNRSAAARCVGCVGRMLRFSAIFGKNPRARAGS
jgi:hypothetical protein